MDSALSQHRGREIIGMISAAGGEKYSNKTPDVIETAKQEMIKIKCLEALDRQDYKTFEGEFYRLNHNRHIEVAKSAEFDKEMYKDSPVLGKVVSQLNLENEEDAVSKDLSIAMQISTMKPEFSSKNFDQNIGNMQSLQEGMDALNKDNDVYLKIFILDYCLVQI